MDLVTMNYDEYVITRTDGNHPTSLFITEMKDTHIFDKAILAGGSIRNLIERNREVKDFDLFLMNPSAIAIDEELGGKQGGVIDLLQKIDTRTQDDLDYVLDSLSTLGYEKIRDNHIAVTTKHKTTGVIVQVIYNVPGLGSIEDPSKSITVEDLFDSFDFTISQFAYFDTMIYYTANAMVDLLHKRLAVHRISYANSSFMRVLKYARRGFTICPGMISQFLTSVINNPEIVNENIISID